MLAVQKQCSNAVAQTEMIIYVSIRVNWELTCIASDLEGHLLIVEPQLY